MRAIVAEGEGGPEVLAVRDLPDPVPGSGEVVIAVRAAGVNRADLLQRAGRYPPPPGASPLIGLEAAGEVTAVGVGVARPVVGDRVMALLNGGGYAERVAVPAAQALPLPERLDWAEGAAVMEVFLTAWQALRRLGGLSAGDAALVHAAASGVGTAAVQVARQLGARVVATSRRRERLDTAVGEGAIPVVPGADGRFAPAVLAATDGRGVDVVAEVVGARYLAEDLASLARGGRILLVGLLGGRRAEIDLGEMVSRHATIRGVSLRRLDADEKADLVAEFGAWGLPRLADGRLRPLVHATLPLDRAADAHRLLDAGDVVGKVVLLP